MVGPIGDIGRPIKPAVSADYPAEADVRLGTAYGNGTYTGTLVAGAVLGSTLPPEVMGSETVGTVEGE